jgi:hypothetical protein
MELVEGVIELDLSLVFALEELDVVEQEDVRAAIATAELVGALIAHGGDEVAGELVSGGTDHVEISAEGFVGDGVEEMCLAKAGRCADEEWVVRRTRRARHGHGRGVGEAVAAPDDEGIERKGGIQTRPRPVRPGWIGRAAVTGGSNLVSESRRSQHLEANVDVLPGERGQDAVDEGPQAQVKPLGVEVAAGADYEPALVEAYPDGVLEPGIVGGAG